jgi:hypothetical protein
MCAPREQLTLSHIVMFTQPIGVANYMYIFEPPVHGDLSSHVRLRPGLYKSQNERFLLNFLCAFVYYKINKTSHVKRLLAVVLHSLPILLPMT